ncbi:hypothetical protein [Polaromonas hydrogenivorans]|uniref:Uncharacterized protein n=1 Tax=Polaromonas hydrogenivorans TaxID=335476 RepID=A0AAU7LW70_9BURK
MIRTDRNSEPLDGSADDLADDTGLLICQGFGLIAFVVALAFYACL